jgi:hypothetical protein
LGRLRAGGRQQIRNVLTLTDFVTREIPPDRKMRERKIRKVFYIFLSRIFLSK